MVARQYLQFYALSQSLMLRDFNLGPFDMAPPRGIVAGFAVELYLKSFLRSKGVSSDDLARQFGHDLERLFDECINHGLDPDRAISTAIYVDLGPHHKSMGFRYVQASASYVETNWTWIAAVLCHLDELIGPQIGVSSGHLVDLNSLDKDSTSRVLG